MAGILFLFTSVLITPAVFSFITLFSLYLVSPYLYHSPYISVYLNLHVLHLLLDFSIAHVPSSPIHTINFATFTLKRLKKNYKKKNSLLSDPLAFSDISARSSTNANIAIVILINLMFKCHEDLTNCVYAEIGGILIFTGATLSSDLAWPRLWGFEIYKCFRNIWQYKSLTSRWAVIF